MEKRLVEPREHGTVKEVMVERLHITVLSKIRHVRAILVRALILEIPSIENEKVKRESYVLLIKPTVAPRQVPTHVVIVILKVESSESGEFGILLQTQDVPLLVRKICLNWRNRIIKNQSYVFILVKNIHRVTIGKWKITVQKYIRCILVQT